MAIQRRRLMAGKVHVHVGKMDPKSQKGRSPLFQKEHSLVPVPVWKGLGERTPPGFQ